MFWFKAVLKWTPWLPPLTVCWFGMQNISGACELASFKRRLNQKLNPNCNTKCAPTPNEDVRIWINEQAAQLQSPPACTEHSQATRNLMKPLNAPATSWMCLLLYKGPAAFSGFLATASPQLFATLLFLLNHLPHLSWKPWPSLPWLLLPSPEFAVLLYYFPFPTVVFCNGYIRAICIPEIQWVCNWRPWETDVSH